MRKVGTVKLEVTIDVWADNLNPDWMTRALIAAIPHPDISIPTGGDGGEKIVVLVTSMEEELNQLA